MTLGTAIVLSALLLSAVVLYAATKDQMELEAAYQVGHWTPRAAGPSWRSRDLGVCRMQRSACCAKRVRRCEAFDDPG